jgi:hypothetical protein
MYETDVPSISPGQVDAARRDGVGHLVDADLLVGERERVDLNPHRELLHRHDVDLGNAVDR